MSGVEARFGRRGRRERPPFSFGPQPTQSRWGSRPPWIALLVALALVVAGGAGAAITWRVHRSAEARSRAELERTVDAYLAAWGRSDWNGMRRLVADPPADLAATYRQMDDALDISAATFTAGQITSKGSSADAAFRARLTLSGLGAWSYPGRLSLVRESGAWRVRWSPHALHPMLAPGLKFARTRTWPERAPILGRDGTPLTVQGDVVTVGVQPGRIQDRQQVLNALQLSLGVDPTEVEAAVDRPGVKPNWFLPVVTVRKSTYLEVKAQLYPVPGLVFRTGKARILIDEGFAQHVIGRVHEATADDLKALGEPYRPGDTVGAYGLERTFERQLAGVPSGSVELVDRAKKVVRTLYRTPGRDPEPVTTTLDVAVQRAADAALDPVGQPAALVALDTRTGDIRAAASRPLDGAERALSLHYPPGSTFKIVTGAALLADGLGLDDQTTCPTEVNAGGKVFKNFEGETFGTLTFATAFARSCNTAFIRLASTLPEGALGDMARTFGFGTDYSLPVPVLGGQFPAPKDDAEAAAAAIGQGRVLASPVHMATVAAAVASGGWRPPRLVSTDPKGTATPLPAGVATALRELMGLVVSQGTAAGEGLPSDVAGKTGTAEFGSKGQTHAWFVGFRGDLAFAVLVEGGGVGGRVAAPIAADFLNGL